MGRKVALRRGSPDHQIKVIERQARGPFGYNPVKVVTCPHCGGRMHAIDAKKHIRG